LITIGNFQCEIAESIELTLECNPSRVFHWLLWISNHVWSGQLMRYLVFTHWHKK